MKKSKRNAITVANGQNWAQEEESVRKDESVRGSAETGTENGIEKQTKTAAAATTTTKQNDNQKGGGVGGPRDRGLEGEEDGGQAREDLELGERGEDAEEAEWAQSEV
eukprot:3474217-Rhodomonas_salina.1